MLSQKSVLARLLANENITVQQGNYETAYFDVKDRVLGLPLWKDMGKDVYDMLVGHEVAHALETPENFNEYKGSEGIPHSWLNIAEDVRIEKLILRRYPGLVGNFKRAYYTLMMVQDLFGIKDKDLSKLGFWDRLNIHAKARDLVEVPFAADELPWVARAKQTETYEEVVEFCRDVKEWLKQKQDEKQEGDGEGQDDGQNGEGQSITVGVITDNETPDGAEETDETPDVIIDMRENMESGVSEKSDSEENQSGQTSSNPEPESGDADAEAETEQTFGKNQKELLYGKDVIFVEGLTKAQTDAVTVPYQVIAEDRRKQTAAAKKSWAWSGNEKFPESKYVTFLSGTKRVVNLMVKEFEMRKAAYRSARARTATKGSLDVTKLHKYRYEDDLFKQVSYLADAKNHGMIMLIDYSGSMSNVLSDVIRQLLALVMFCKRVNIPFEVYAFTSLSSGEHWNDVSNTLKKVSPSVTRTEHDLGLLELFNTSMTKSDYEEAFKMMFWQSTNSSHSPFGRSAYEGLGSTPLNNSLMAMVHKIKAFRQKHRVQKMNLVTLTDGDSNPIRVYGGTDLSSTRPVYSRNYHVNVDGKILKLKTGYGRDGRKSTEALLRNIAEMDVKVINYFVASSKYDLNGEIGYIENVTPAQVKSAINRDGCYVIDNDQGYDRRFILMRNSALRGDVEELDVNGDMTTAKIAKAFNTASSSKKKSRIVTQKFAEMVA